MFLLWASIESSYLDQDTVQYVVYGGTVVMRRADYAIIVHGGCGLKQGVAAPSRLGHHLNPHVCHVRLVFALLSFLINHSAALAPP